MIDKDPHHHNNHFLALFQWDGNGFSMKSRIYFLIICFACGFLLIGLRLFLVSTNKIDYSQSAKLRSDGFRKEIVDRNGTLLAVNLPSYSLFANPSKVVNAQDCVLMLSNVISGIDRAKLLEDLSSQKTFVWVKRDISPKEKEEIIALGLPGFEFENEQKRVYTFGNLFSHIIGYVGRDFTGLAGVEKEFDDFLTNRDASLKKEEQDKPLVLSLDVRLQSILSEELDRGIKEFSAKGAVGIVADPNNGEILAMISKPDFDPHHPEKADADQLFNMASLGVIETGSVFKALTMAIGFDTKAVDFHDMYDLSYMKVGKFQLKDAHPRPGWHSVAEIFLHSSNIGVGQIILEVGKDKFKKYLKELSLFEQVEIELPERGKPLVLPDSKWNDLSMVTMSYGYALSITPIHFVRAVAATANGGILHPMTIIKRKADEQVLSKRVFSEKTSEKMRKLFRITVQEGTGKKSEVKGYFVGGQDRHSRNGLRWQI